MHTMSEVLRLELRPFCVKVLTVVTASVTTNIFAKPLLSGLPKGSFYANVRREIAERAAGNEGDGLNSPEEFASKVVNDIIAGKSGLVYRGPLSSLVRFCIAWLPTYVIVGLHR